MENHSHHGSGDSAANGEERHVAVGGLSIAADGLRLSPTETRFEAGTPRDWEFRVHSADGEVVTEFEAAHGRAGHLVVVRRDLTEFQHRHPVLDADGAWRVDGLELPRPGVYRAFFDSVVDGRATTLGVDLFAPGQAEVAPRPGTTRLAAAGPYEVEFLPGDVEAGAATRLAFEVRRDDGSVAHLDQYLGALGHLVVLREGDLGYLHVHPRETTPESGRIEFDARFPTPGRYRLFLQSKPDEKLLTTRHDVRVAG